MRIGHVEIIYDGQCPLCSSLVRMSRLRLHVDSVELIDARSADPRVQELVAMGYDLDEGMIMRCDGQIYHGAAALRMLAELTGKPGLPIRLIRSPQAAGHIYPILRQGRRLLLRLLGRRPIGR
ncbi:DCC1-like thiol-disulfide oxidoreductase family protein [Paracoccus onubensis]|uniref:DUF393 domain-containing protein n=1 Tax=Paracoccus onubensis TaxID=1675788 RepID=A0A418SPR9_9RHOB|nr:DCC1-like thiol-disulfide oxidoreductase family protein [Paracoccus onubensis]RJE82912.1 DUF393 domain-containing protein [Paracoccus onubensis]